MAILKDAATFSDLARKVLDGTATREEREQLVGDGASAREIIARLQAWIERHIPSKPSREPVGFAGRCAVCGGSGRTGGKVRDSSGVGPVPVEGDVCPHCRGSGEAPGHTQPA